MTFNTTWRSDFGANDHIRLSRSGRPQQLLGGAAVVSVALLCAWIICVNLGGPAVDQIVAQQPSPAPATAAQTASNNPATQFDTYPLFDSRPLFDARWGFSPETFSLNVPSQGGGASTVTASASAPNQSTIQQTQQIASAPPQSDRVAQRIPVSPPLDLRLPSTRTASLPSGAAKNRVAVNTTADEPTLFEKLFGKPATLTLAYASPDDSGLGAGTNLTPGRYDQWTAVYDISAHKVYMPDGKTLEAHSGYGSLLDDPRHADAKDRGVTPPDVYNLQPREALFHGVRALRLIPVDDSKVFGRTGLLAHSYMLGPNGDFNGCVSFKDYDAFLRAYQNHEIKRLVVVDRLS